MVIVMHLQVTNRTESMLRITTEKKRSKVFLAVEGRLAGPWVAALEQCWRELHAASPREKFHVNLCGVSFIDAAGKVLLMEIHRQGGQLIAEGCLNQAIVQEIVARHKQAECVAWKCTDAGAATDPGSSGRPSAETKHHGTDRDFASSAKRTRQEHSASRSVATGEGADLGRSAESKPAGPVWRQDSVSRISQDAWTISSIFRRAELRQSGLRPDAVAEISGSAEYGELEQGEQPLDTRASDSAGSFAVHRDAARDGQCAGVAIASGSGAGVV